MEQKNGIFAGLKILELGSGAAGPVATRYFADQGARVIRIESAKRPDFLRLLHLRPNEPHNLEAAPMFVLLNANKESLTLNLSKPEGVELLRKLIAWTDVVAENFSPGVMKKWGLEYEDLQAINPGIVMVSGCLFGQTGPQRSYPGFGGQGSAISGFNHFTGWPDREAIGPHATITDSLSPRFVATAIAAALLERRRTGKGRYIDLSQIETGIYSLSEAVVRVSATGKGTTRRGNHCEYGAPHSIYPCSGEDRWIAIAVFSDSEWRALCAVVGDPAWTADGRFDSLEGRLAHQSELDRHLSDWTGQQESFALMERLQAAGVEAGVVQNFDDLLHDPQLAHRGHFQPLTHAHLGRLQFERPGFRLSESPSRLDRPGPLLGEHNERILRELLGFSEAEIERLVREEVVV